MRTEITNVLQVKLQNNFYGSILKLDSAFHLRGSFSYLNKFWQKIKKTYLKFLLVLSLIWSNSNYIGKFESQFNEKENSVKKNIFIFILVKDLLTWYRKFIRQEASGARPLLFGLLMMLGLLLTMLLLLFFWSLVLLLFGLLLLLLRMFFCLLVLQLLFCSFLASLFLTSSNWFGSSIFEAS